MSQAYLIFGATGVQGGATARLLLSQNKLVHDLVRSTTSPASLKLKEAATILFEGDYDNLPVIKQSLQGVRGVFLIVSMGPTQVDQFQAIVDLIREVPTVTSVVISTTLFAGNPEKWAVYETKNPILHWYYSGKAGQEKAAKKAGFENLTILRPSFLMCDFYLPHASMNYPDLPTKNVLAHRYNETTVMPYFSEEDVGMFAVAAFNEPEKFRGEEIELGSESLRIGEVLEKLRKVWGKDVLEKKLTVEEAAEMEGVEGFMFHEMLMIWI